MKVVEALAAPVTQAEFAEVIGVSEAKVSQLIGEGYIVKGETARDWLHSYLRRLREVAAGRSSGEPGAMDLVQERAALARAQREAQELKNKIARGEYAPIGLLADVLGEASSAMVDCIEQLEGALRKSSPHLPVEAKDTMMTTLADARNEWIRGTKRAVFEMLALRNLKGLPLDEYEGHDDDAESEVEATE